MRPPMLRDRVSALQHAGREGKLRVRGGRRDQPRAERRIAAIMRQRENRLERQPQKRGMQRFGQRQIVKRVERRFGERQDVLHGDLVGK